jgi:hypothetical protein
MIQVRFEGGFIHHHHIWKGKGIVSVLITSGFEGIAAYSLGKPLSLSVLHFLGGIFSSLHEMDNRKMNKQYQ